MGFDLKGVLKSVVPWIGAAIGGPFGAMAGKVAALALGTEDSSDKGLQEAIQNATPEQLIALKAADQRFQETMQTLGYENIEKLEEIAAGDRADARAREIAVRDNTPRNLAYGYGLMFLLTLAGFIWIAVEQITITPDVKTSIDILLGCMIGMVLGSKEYFFGSSSGSRTKDETISKLSK